ncbi:MAG TPA: DUF1992 domain-containing protein [Desulfonauticus sp.]|nr:MAG: DnaJ-like protein [Desulfonauticus sp. 38_4375]MDK2921741.1 hypothetical protein [Desulfonauticus sp.]HCO12034.1 DUF1992 domain-containing protein [Desulfonauticus sp.]
MDIFVQLAEEKIKKALEKGELDNLPGKGKPLNLEEDANIPADLKIAYKILKNSGYLPEEVSTQQEITTTLELLEQATDEQEKYRQLQKLNLLITKINLQRKRPVYLEYNQVYFEKVINKIKVNKSK